MEKRVYFSKLNQKKFIQYLKQKSQLSWKELAEKLNINEGTLCKSYLFGLSSLPYNIFKKIILILNENEAGIIKKYSGEIKDQEIVIGRKVFGEQKKTLEEIKLTFTNSNLDLNISNIKFSAVDIKKSIKLPDKITPELAEELGMQFGDGFLSARKYDYRLKGNPYCEKDYYNDYIKPLFKRLYNIDIILKDYDKSYGFEIFSKAVWEFKTKTLGIAPGKKNNIPFPDILKINNKKILCAFLRGLFDTDGSISFKSKYGYKEYYPAIELQLTSKNLIKDVAKILSMLGFNPGVSYNENYGRIWVYGINAFKRYENLIGWSSPKNLNKVNAWKRRYPELYGDCGVMVA